MVDSFGKSKRANVLQSLIALAKYSGNYEELKARIKAYGIKWHKPSSLQAFLRILNNSNSDILQWFKQASKVLNEDSKAYLEFALCSGLRASECIEALNLIIRLHRENRLNEYYNQALSTLEHFKYPKHFLRNTKNAFVSIVPVGLINRIVLCEPVSYESVKMRLQRKHLPLRINELRDYYASYMVHSGLIKEEIDLLQGRIGESIFIRHYFSPSFKELKDRTLSALEKTQNSLGLTLKC